MIYGWHKLDGTPIQPVYNGHEQTYADYSHGIRLVKDTVLVDGIPRFLSSVLADPVYHLLLSDEGIISIPYYTLSTHVLPEEVPPPYQFQLHQNYPNPFNPITTICFTVSSSGKYQLRVYTLTGKEVSVLEYQELYAGNQTVRYDARDLPSGTYFYKLESKNGALIRKMTLVK
ncbi:MAG: T9SS type A sorting domain-containing protein [bacterium]